MFLLEYINTNLSNDGIPESMALLGFGIALILSAVFLRKLMDGKSAESKVEAKRVKRSKR